MNPLALAGPAVEPIPLAEMKAYLRLDGSDEDALVSSLVTAARLAVERAARVALVAQSWRYETPGWPAGGIVPLPLSPILSIDMVRVLAAGGAPLTLASALVRLDDTADPARLVLDSSVARPAGDDVRLSVDLTAGFGATATAVPAPLRLAVQRLVAGWFEARGDGSQARTVALPPDIAALLAPYVRPRLA